MNRLSIDALIMGLAIGLAAILLDAWVGTAGWLARIAALLLVGSLLCGVQYLLLLRHKRR